MESPDKIDLCHIQQKEPKTQADLRFTGVLKGRRNTWLPSLQRLKITSGFGHWAVSMVGDGSGEGRAGEEPVLFHGFRKKWKLRKRGQQQMDQAFEKLI